MAGKKTPAKRIDDRAHHTPYADDLDMGRGEMPKFRPSDVIVNWHQNTSRAPFYKWKGVECCFCEDDVADLTDPDDETSILRAGLKQPIIVYLNAHKRPVLIAGYRRLFALLVLEERGLLEEVPILRGKGSGYIECVVEPQPKDDDGWKRVALSNLAENKRKPATPLDIAWAIRRIAFSATEMKGGELGLGLAAAGEMVKGLTPDGKPLAERTCKRYLQLLKMPKGTQGAVHRGEMSLLDAVSEASRMGHGDSKGPRVQVKHTVLRRIPEGKLAEIVGRRQPAGDRLISADEVEGFALAIAGAPGAVMPEWGKKLIEAAEQAKPAKPARAKVEDEAA
jgi:hypothetical protein